jgi:hypothetical protein
MRRRKKELKHRFWADVYEGAKLFFLSGWWRCVCLCTAIHIARAGLLHEKWYPKHEVAHAEQKRYACSTDTLLTGGELGSIHFDSKVSTVNMAQFARVSDRNAVSFILVCHV